MYTTILLYVVFRYLSIILPGHERLLALLFLVITLITVGSLSLHPGKL